MRGRGVCELRLLESKLRCNDGEEPVGRLFRTVAILIAFADLGCGSQPPRQASDENNFDQTPTGTSSDTGANDTAPPPEAPGKLNEEQEAQMLVVLKRGGDKAARCPEVVPDAPTGEGEVQVVFDGQKGRVTDAVVGAPFAGTPIESCIKRAFIGEIILPFTGEPKSVPYTVKLPDKKAPPAPDKDKKK
jgi:hypothetical protein